MADLGTITGRSVGNTESFIYAATTPPTHNSVGGSRRLLPWWTGLTNTDQANIDISGTISGTVIENSVFQQRWVRLHYRISGELIMATYSDPVTGAFSFSGLDKSDLYYAVKLNNLSDPTLYNAEIYDLLSPV